MTTHETFPKKLSYKVSYLSTYSTIIFGKKNLDIMILNICWESEACTKGNILPSYIGTSSSTPPLRKTSSGLT